MLLSDVDIRKLIEEQGFIEDYTDLDIQLQQCGFDLTLDYIEKPFYGIDKYATVIDFSNRLRAPTPMQQIYTDELDISYPEEAASDSRRGFNLPPGNYVFHTKEKVRFPANIGAILRCRSSLIRAGIVFASSCIDPGYYGHLIASLHIPTPGLKITQGARFCQMLSWYLSSPAERLYDGIYREKDNGKKA